MKVDFNFNQEESKQNTVNDDLSKIKVRKAVSLSDDTIKVNESPVKAVGYENNTTRITVKCGMPNDESKENEVIDLEKAIENYGIDALREIADAYAVQLENEQGSATQKEETPQTGKEADNGEKQDLEKSSIEAKKKKTSSFKTEARAGRIIFALRFVYVLSFVISAMLILFETEALFGKHYDIEEILVCSINLGIIYIALFFILFQKALWKKCICDTVYVYSSDLRAYGVQVCDDDSLKITLEKYIGSKKMEFIKDAAFSGLSTVKEIEIPEGYTLIKSYAFNGCDSLDKVTLPSTIEAIDEFAFASCVSLYKIVIPENVKIISESMFSFCSSLSIVELPREVTDIKANAFRSCTAMRSITLPKTLNYIGANAFKRCLSLRKIHFEGTKSQWEKIKKEENWCVDAGKFVISCTDGDYN